MCVSCRWNGICSKCFFILTSRTENGDSSINKNISVKERSVRGVSLSLQETTARSSWISKSCFGEMRIKLYVKEMTVVATCWYTKQTIERIIWWKQRLSKKTCEQLQGKIRTFLLYHIILKWQATVLKDRILWIMVLLIVKAGRKKT